MRRRFIAMKRVGATSGPIESAAFSPSNNKLYDYAGQAKNYSKRVEYKTTTVNGVATQDETKIDDGYVLMIDLDAAARVTFDAKGKPVGIAKDTEPTLLDEYNEAERMLEVWAKRADALRTRIREEGNE